MAKYACFRSDNMDGTHLGSQLVTITCDGDVQNGTIVKIGAFKADEREIRDYTLADAGDAVSTLGVVAGPEVVKDVKYYAQDDFVNLDGDEARVYRLAAHNQFSVTAEAFDGDVPEVGDAVGAAGGKLVKGGSNVGTCMEVAEQGGRTWYMIEVAA